MSTAAPQSSATQEEQFVAFRLANETYGIPIVNVHEIIRTCEITRIPRSAPHVRGIVNLRGTVVPVIDLRLRLGLPLGDESAESRIVVVEIGTGTVGMIVDSVSQVIRIPGDQIEQPSLMIADPEHGLIRGMGRLGEEIVILLDLVRTLETDR